MLPGSGAVVKGGVEGDGNMDESGQQKGVKEAQPAYLAQSELAKAPALVSYGSAQLALQPTVTLALAENSHSH